MDISGALHSSNISQKVQTSKKTESMPAPTPYPNTANSANTPIESKNKTGGTLNHDTKAWSDPNDFFLNTQRPPIAYNQCENILTYNQTEKTVGYNQTENIRLV